tara:strand:+ start:1926 stop:2336 length:411 start_codon:yes stop_codon:yes gene_type:complete
MDNLPKQLQKNYKTKLCWHYTNNRFCKFGKNCAFAHGDDELVEQDKIVIIQRNTTTECKSSKANPFEYLLNSAPAPPPNVRPFRYKTKMCKFFMKYKSCPFGSKCSYAHCKMELLPDQAFFEKMYTDLANDFSIYV